MNLLPNEEKLVSSNEDKIILTNHRIHLTDSVWGQSFTISIFLEDISSIEIKYKSTILFIILGVLCILGGFYASAQGGSFLGGIFLGGIFLALWWFTRKHVVSVSSNGGSSLNFIVQGMADEKISDFVHKISVAKQTRVNQIHKVYQLN